ncbi:SMP-30/gluconolactonase/LRE family protein [Nocardia sp. CWNU-33]|uniref:SMP-30/gluconolactonase/LRE family protein n=1 Tax=Nocardia sp. CWNU-33 TaxID=3392117 RepID=UPI00398F18A9
MRRIHRCWPIAALVAVACGGVATPSTAAAEPIAACAPAQAATAVPAGVPILDWSENVGYDAQGNLWVSRLYRNEVQRYNSSGALTGRVPVEYPGAVRLGPDGLLYVVYGDSPTSVLRPGGVVRFDPTAADPKPETFVSGFTMPNGAAFDQAGNLYVAATSGVIRIGRDGVVDTEWTARATTATANGIVVRDRSLYLTSNGNPLGRVLRMSIDDPSDRSVVADLSSTLPGIPDFADDLVDRDGILYVTTISGQLVRIDPDTNAACAVLTDQPMTSVAAVPGHLDELLAGTEGGAILRIRLSR